MLKALCSQGTAWAFGEVERYSTQPQIARSVHAPFLERLSIVADLAEFRDGVWAPRLNVGLEAPASRTHDVRTEAGVGESVEPAHSGVGASDVSAGTAPTSLSLDLDTSAPASDRVVRIDHNSALYREAHGALMEVEEALRGDNEFPDPELRNQILAEISAGRQLFEAPVVKVAIVLTVLGGALTTLSVAVPGLAVSILGAAAWAAVVACISWADRQL